MSGLWTILVGNALPAVALAGFAYLVSRMFRRPALTHLLWVLVLVKLVTPPLLPWSISVSAETAAAIGLSPTDDMAAIPARFSTISEPVGNPMDRSTPAINETNRSSFGTATATVTPDSRRSTASPTLLLQTFRWLWTEWLLLLGIVWMTGILFSIYSVAKGLMRMRCRFQAAEPIDRAARRHVQVLAGRLGLDRTPAVGLVEGIVSPLVWGVGPFTRIIFPRELWERLAGPSRDALLLHELAHYRRGDQWVRVLEILVGCLYWWHPCVWWARRELATAEEECCDAWVVRHAGHQPRNYAEAIITTLDYLAGEPVQGRVITTGVNTMPVLKRRLRNIMHRTVSPVLPQPALWGLLAAAVVTFPLQPLVQVESGNSAAASLAPNRLLSDALRSLPIEQQAIPAAPPVEVPAAALQRPDEPRGFWSRELTMPARSFILSPDRRFKIELQNGHEAVAVIDNETQARHDLSDEQITCLVFTPDGDRFVTGSRTGEVRVWRASTGEAVNWLGPMEEGQRVTSIDISPEGDWVVTGSAGGSVMVWELASGSPKATWTGPSRVNCIRVLDDQRIAVSTGHFLDQAPGHIVILNAESLEPILDRETQRIVAIIEADEQSGGGLLLTDYSGTVWSWDGMGTELTFREEVPKTSVERAAFSSAYRVVTPL